MIRSTLMSLEPPSFGSRFPPKHSPRSSVAHTMESNSHFTQYFDTAYTPSNTELNAIHTLIARHQAEMDGIDNEMAELQRKLADLQGKKSAHADYIRRYRNLAAPVRRLSDDILLPIFLALLPQSGIQRSSSHPSTIISHVCHRWRRLSLSLPLLWRHINLSPPGSRCMGMRRPIRGSATSREALSEPLCFFQDRGAAPCL